MLPIDFNPPKDTIKPFDGCVPSTTLATVHYPTPKGTCVTSFVVNCWEDRAGEKYLSGNTVAFLDYAKAYYWHKNEPTEINITCVAVARMERLYNLLHSMNLISPHVVLSEYEFQLSGFPLSPLLFRAIKESTFRKFNGSVYELLEEVYENFDWTKGWTEK